MARMPSEVIIKLTLDTTKFEASVRRAARSMAKLSWAMHRAHSDMWRATLTPGEKHIDRMCREVAGKPDAALRLLVAAGCVAPVLDHQEEKS